MTQKLSTQAKTNFKEKYRWLNDYYNQPENWLRLQTKKAVLNMAIAIKLEREKKGISQRDLSKISGIAQSTISKAERGNVVGIDTVAKLSIVLGLEPKLTFKEISKT